MHCRPLLRLFKMMSTEAFKLNYKEGSSDEVSVYVENTKMQLRSIFKDKLEEDKELSSQVKFGSHDDKESEDAIKQLVDGLTC